MTWHTLSSLFTYYFMYILYTQPSDCAGSYLYTQRKSTMSTRIHTFISWISLIRLLEMFVNQHTHAFMLSCLDSLLLLDGVCDPCGNETGRQCLHITSSRSLARSFFFLLCFLSDGSTLHNGCHFLHWHMLKAVKSPYPRDNRGWPDSSLLLPA